MRKFASMLALLVLVSMQYLHAQTVQITGTVTSSEDGLPLPGVSVVIKGTTIGGATDIDGKYTVNAPSDAVALIFSSVGMKTQDVAINGRSIIDVVLEPDNMKLDEVVVTALGISREKKALGYAVTDVKADELNKAAEQNAIQSLAGKVSGVQVVASGGTPGASSKILIRGASTFSGSTQPLIVVDGVPIDNSTIQTTAGDNPFNSNLSGVNNSNRAVDIDPEDIESVTVLKGPAAAALYGAKAGNGVIIYTTKRGKANKGIGVSVNYALEINQVSKLPKLQDTYAQGSGGVYSVGDPGPDMTYWTSDDVSYGTSNSWGPKIADTPGLQSYDNVGNFFETSMSHKMNASITGGSETGSFRISMGSTNQNGMIPNTEMKRNSVRITGDQNVTDKIKIGGTASYVNNTGIKAQNGSNLAGVMLGLMRTPASYNLEPYTYENGNQRQYFVYYDNPYFTAEENTFKDNVNRVIGNVYVNWNQSKLFNVNYKIGVDAYSDHRQQVYAVGSYGNDDNDGVGQVNYNDLTSRNIYSNLVISGEKELTGDLNLQYTAGHNIETNYYSDDFSRGKSLAIPNFYNLSNASTLYASNYESETFTTAAFGQLDFAFKKSLFLSLTGRQEWASTYGEDDRGFFYPSVTASWLFTEMLSLPSWLSFGKLRLGYAEVGIFPDPYRTKTFFTSPIITDGFTNGLGFPYGSANGFGYSSTLGNKDLKPERKKGYEVGLKLNFLQRFDLDFTYYSEKTEDILLYKPIAPSSGFSSNYTNAGELENKGYEIQLTAKVVNSSDFKWEVAANWSQNKNEVLKLDDGVDQISIESAFTSIGSYAIVGEPVGVFYGSKWKRDANGNLIIGSNGIPLKEDAQGNVGNPNPDWLAGLRNTFSYKNITVSALLDFRKGGDVYNGTYARLNNLGRTEESAEHRESTYVIPGVLEDGTPNKIAISSSDYYKKYVGDAGGAAEQFVEDVDWVRLRDVSVSWRYQPKTGFIKSVDLSFTGRNLWLSTNYKGVDPETSLTGAGSNIGGFDYFNNPGSKSYVFGIKMNF